MREHYDLVDFISIHALVKRATIHDVNFCCWKLISIHALVKRATIDDYAAHGDYDISIHALVKRATKAQS